MKLLHVRNEVPAGTPNGTTATFTLANAPSGEVAVYQDGDRLSPGECYFVEGRSLTFMPAFVPPTNSRLLCDYEAVTEVNVTTLA